jgi:hypothetical protein
VQAGDDAVVGLHPRWVQPVIDIESADVESFSRSNLYERLARRGRFAWALGAMAGRFLATQHVPKASAMVSALWRGRDSEREQA